MTKCTVNRNGYVYAGEIIGEEHDAYLGTVEIIVKRDDSDDVNVELPEDVTVID